MLIPLATLDFSGPDIRTIPPPPRADRALEASIKARGLLQPILVRPLGNAHQVVLGRRRARAAIALAFPMIQAEVRDMTDQQAIEAQIIENQQREAMHPIDQWRATLTLLDAGATIEDAAMALGLDTRAARRMALLAKLHPKIAALIQTSMPPINHLGTIARATQKQQADALKAPYAVMEGQPNWLVIARACAGVTIPRAWAIFDPEKFPEVRFEEDLFAEPGSPGQFVTRDTKGFLAAQEQALVTRVQKAQAKGERIQIAGWKSNDIVVSAGYVRHYLDIPAKRPSGKTGPRILTAVSQGPGNLGMVVEYLATPKTGNAKPSRETAKALSNGAAASNVRVPPGEDAPPAEPHADATIEPEAPTKKGQSLIAAAKTDALRDHLRNPPGAHEGLSLLTRCLLIALTADNVHVYEGKYSKADLSSLRPLLVRPDGSLTDLNDAELHDLLGEALARILIVTDPVTFHGSGRAAEWIAAALEVPPPRLDTPEFLATLDGAELRRAAQAHAPDRSLPATVAALRQQLAGALPDWRPAVFGAPGPQPVSKARRSPHREQTEGAPA